MQKEFVPPAQTANQQFYLKVLKRLCDSVRKKQPAMWSSGFWFLHLDNAPAHTTLNVLQFLAKKTYNLYLVIEVPDHVYIFYAYRLYFADKDISGIGMGHTLSTKRYNAILY